MACRWRIREYENMRKKVDVVGLVCNGVAVHEDI